MDVILLAGYRQDKEAMGLVSDDSGVAHIDHQITTLQEMGLSPIVVLSGLAGDEVLRSSKKLSSCELIFDTHGEAANLFSNVRAGIHGVEQTCFILPVEVPCPPKEAWVSLRRAFQSSGFSTKIALIQLQDSEGAPWHWGFPLFVTRLGRHLLLHEDQLTSLTDPKLKVWHADLAVPDPSL